MEDLQSVLAMIRKATRKMNDRGIFQWDDIYPNRSILKRDIERQQMYLIENDGTHAGVITLNEEAPPEYDDVPWAYQGKVLVVHRLTIDPKHQGKKLASKLMDFAEEEATRRGYDTVRLDAFTLNPAALALYHRRGYREAGTVRFRKGVFFCYEKPLVRTVRGRARGGLRHSRKLDLFFTTMSQSSRRRQYSE
jgi:GNAT superfamily N-acetyltransferase